MRLLLVEEQLVRQRLQPAGYETDLFSTAAEAQAAVTLAESIKVVALVIATLVIAAVISALSEPLFKKIFGYGRSRAGKRLDQLLLAGVMLAVAMIGLYACYGG